MTISTDTTPRDARPKAWYRTGWHLKPVRALWQMVAFTVISMAVELGFFAAKLAGH